VQSRDAGERDLASAVARPTRRDGVPQGIPVPGDEGRAETSASGREGAAPDGATAVARARRALAPRAAAGAPPVDPSGDGPGTRERAAPLPAEAAGEGGARRSGRYDPRLLPSASTFERLTGAPGARLPGVEEGDATSVSTRRFRYADFHLRVKESVAREWDPNRVFDARDPDASRFGRSTRGATVDIVLEASGALHEVRVVRSSGLDFYDRELVRAIRAAAPFPNPPRGLVGADGLVSLRDWRFDLAFTGTVLPPGGLTGGVRSPIAP
jgi:TonB family protein